MWVCKLNVSRFSFVYQNYLIGVAQTQIAGCPLKPLIPIGLGIRSKNIPSLKKLQLVYFVCVPEDNLLESSLLPPCGSQG